LATKLIEGVITDMLTYLQANMPAKLDELDTRFGDGITLTDIAGWYRAQQRAIQAFPAVVVMAHNTRPIERGDGWLRGHHQLDIIIMATGQDSQQLSQEAQRYVLAIFECLKDAESSSGWTIIHERFDADYDQVYTADDTFVTDARLTVTASRIEAT
jgi:hypothetical protein